MPKNIPEWRTKHHQEITEVRRKNYGDMISEIQNQRDEVLNVKDYQSKVLMVEIMKIIDSFETMQKTTENLMFACAQLLNYRKQILKYNTDLAILNKKEKDEINKKGGF